MHALAEAKPLLDRLADKFTVDDGCWHWTASCNSGGYGKVYDGDTLRPAHRVVYEMLVGPIPDGLVLDHLCRNHGCVRPDHLEPVTSSVNTRRGVGIGKGRPNVEGRKRDWHGRFA